MFKFFPRLRVTNRKQFEELVRRMEENPTVAKGLKFAEGAMMTKPIFQSAWAETTTALNSLGPPSRSSAEWQKVWKTIYFNNLMYATILFLFTIAGVVRFQGKNQKKIDGK